MDSFPNVKVINDEKSTFLGEHPTCNEKDERKLSKDAGDALSLLSQSVTDITRPSIEKNLPQIISVKEGEERFKNIGDQLQHHSMKAGKDLSYYKSQSKPAEYSKKKFNVKMFFVANQNLIYFSDKECQAIAI